MNFKSLVKLVLIICIIAVLSFIALNGLEIGIYKVVPMKDGIVLGLDLQGGLYSIYEAKVEPNDPDKSSKIESAIQVMRNRLDQANQYEATVAPQGDNRIRVEIPGIKDPQQLMEILGKPAVLEFVDPEGNVVITGQDIKSAKPGFGEKQMPVVNFELLPEGAKKFADATAKNIGKAITITLDKEIISSPIVESVISGGKGVITGMKSIEEARQLANLIQSGALPVELEQIEIRTIGATLGANALQKGIQAGIIGSIFVLLFMLVYYRLPGLVADLALIVYILITGIVLVTTKVALTLPGLAGVILSIGMAVDANVIIFERIKEELKAGKTLRASVDSGFHKAFGAILDSNITTIIAALVLWYLGTGPIQGFAKTLFIGVLASMFTAIFFTRYIIRLVMDLNLQNRKLYGA